MPLYRFRLQAQDSENYRQGTTEAESKEAAHEYLVQREERYVFYRLDTAEMAEVEAEPDTPRNRARRAIHAQVQPYELVSLEEVK